MKFLDLDGVQAFKAYNDSVYITAEDVDTVDPVPRDTYTKDEIDENNEVISAALNALNANKENVSNKVTSISSTSTDNQYPSALAVYEALQDAAGGGDENVIEDITFNGSSVPISNKTAQITGQAALVSGVNIKTINNESILGSGNITITGGGMGEVELDTSDITNGIYISKSDGSEVSYSGWSATDFIDISEGTQIKADRKLDYSAFYSSASTSGFISSANINTSYLAIPSNAKYVRISGSTSDMNAATVTILASTSNTGEENVIEVVKVNGTALTPDANKAVDITVPTESTVSGWGFTKNTGTYSKPSGGIPATDLASAVQTSLGKADTALQSYTETDPVFTASAAAGITSSDITSWNNKVSNVQSDWNATSGAAVILNKPTIPNDSGLVHTTGNETIGGTKTITGTLSFGGSEGGTNSKIVLDEDSEVNMYFATMNLTSSSINTIASDWSNIIRKATANGTATTLQQDLDAKQNAITSTNKLDYSLLTNTPTIPAAPGTLKTNNTAAQTASASEALSGTINLHKVAKTGTYSDLIGTPTIPTESTVSGWGFTKNSGTVTGVKMNGTTKTPTSGTVDLGTVITSETSLSKGTTTGNGNAVTDISVSGHQITLTKGSTFLTSETSLSKGTTTGSGNAVTDIGVSGHQITLTKGTTFLTSHQDISGKANLSGAAFTGAVTGTSSGNTGQFRNITISSSEPTSSQGNNGDIWIVV